MTRTIPMGLLVLGALACCGALARAEDLASIEKKILKQWQKHRSLKAKVTEEETAGAQDRKATKYGEGAYEWMRKGNDYLFRLEMQSSMEVEAGGQKMSFKLDLLNIYDGKHLYTVSERAGMKMAVKTKLDPKRGAELTSFFETLRAENDLKLLEETAVDGYDAYAIEAKPKSTQPGRPYARLVYYFSKEHGVLLKQESRDQSGKAVQTVTYSDLEFDAKIDPQRFEFKAPEGVTVRDLTGE
jgi:outer membrane lipoprotein-sorting protein